MKGWTWVLAVVAAAGVLAAVAFGAYQAGRHHGGHDEVVRITTPADGNTPGVQVVHVSDGGRWGWHGHGGFFPGFFFAPLLFLLVVFLIFRFAFWGRWCGWRSGPWDSRRFD